ncbi:neuropeptide SIFamide receptor-like [Oppia nitens]|uniref:neuropeptide SIFamide receptor-like n=1 Tax=Oppia nitens TaxID=1686743 RepID=UPI0023DAC9A5|nr:neuropeptide SIFamide receptor-like [Oppia nitens]
MLFFNETIRQLSSNSRLLLINDNINDIYNYINTDTTVNDDDDYYYYNTITAVTNGSTITSTTTTTTGSSGSNTGAADDCSANLDISVIDFQRLQYPRPELIRSSSAGISLITILQIVVCLVVSLVILVGNGAVIVAVIVCHHLRSTINYYLTNLAVSSILVCGFCLWINQIDMITKPFYLLGSFMCKFNAFIQMTCLTSSVLTLSAISLDRFVAILYPLKARFTKQRTGLIISGIWLASMIISIPFLLFRRHHYIYWHDFTESRCMETWPTPRYWSPQRQQCVTLNTYKKLYYLLVTVIMFFLPVLVMLTAYSLIVKKLWQRVVPGDCLTKRQYSRQMASKKRLIVLYSQFGHSSHDSGESQFTQLATIQFL